jgi:hypothetical protein
VDAAERLARAVDEVSDAVLRTAFVRHELAALPVDEAVDVLSLCLGATELGDPRAQKLFLTAGVALAPVASTPVRERLAEGALRRGHRHLARLLTRDVLEESSAALVPDLGLGRPVSLGERKSLARRRDRQLLARVIADPHPDVIRLLLGNPMIVEADIVRLAARRPIAPDVAREIAGSPRWMVRYAVQLAIARNPWTPRDVALWVVPLLRPRELAELTLDGTLSPSVRDAAARACRRPALV